MNILNHFKKQKDGADAVLTPSIIAIPIIAVTFMLGVTISDNAVNRASYRELAQNSVNAGVTQINPDGNINPERAIKRVITSYESADQTRTLGQKQKFRNESVCKTAEINGVKRSLPYYEFSIEDGGGEYDANGQYTGRGHDSGTSPVMSIESRGENDYSYLDGYDYSMFTGNGKILRATIYDSANNKMHIGNIIPECQEHESVVSSVVTLGNIN